MEVDRDPKMFCQTNCCCTGVWNWLFSTKSCHVTRAHNLKYLSATRKTVLFLSVDHLTLPSLTIPSCSLVIMILHRDLFSNAPPRSLAYPLPINMIFVLSKATTWSPRLSVLTKPPPSMVFFPHVTNTDRFMGIGLELSVERKWWELAMEEWWRQEVSTIVHSNAQSW